MINLAQEFHRAGILTEHFKQVPDDYLAFPSGKHKADVRIRCVCGTETDLRKGQLASCQCGRTFWNGSKVFAAPAPELEPHPCVPERFELRDGRYAFSDYCMVCKADL